MTQDERRSYLIHYLLSERPEYSKIAVPESEDEQKKLLRSLLNVRPPHAVGNDFLTIQDEYLKYATSLKGITSIRELNEAEPDIYLWQGDITTLECDAVVNAANSQMLGCFCPCHGCIDNAIHTFAGVQLRKKCAQIMSVQSHKEKTGTAKITPGYNLPCKYILHTVGPIVGEHVTQSDRDALRSCYASCLALAEQNGVKSIAFCCISTGEFHFPNREAANIAVKTVRDYKTRTNSKIKVIVNVFKDMDYRIYSEILGDSAKT